MKTQYDWSFKNDGPAIGLCECTHRSEDKIISRKFFLAEDGEIVIRLEYRYDGYSYCDYKFWDQIYDAGWNIFRTGDPKNEIKEHHESDPEAGFEQYEKKYKKWIK